MSTAKRRGGKQSKLAAWQSPLPVETASSPKKVSIKKESEIINYEESIEEPMAELKPLVKKNKKSE